MGIRAPQDSDDRRECSRPSQKFIHFLPFHPSGARLATASRLDKSDYDALLQVDFRYCQALGRAEFVATQNGCILADGHIPPRCVRCIDRQF
eukprot:6077905-Alexandrium_andersonii.AAC.1